MLGNFKTTIIAGFALLATAGMGMAQTTTTTEESGDHKFEKAANIYGECKSASVKDFDKIREQIRAFTDIKIMAETVNDPEKFFALLGVINDPHTIHVMSSCATEPVMWDTWMKGGTDPQNWIASLSALMDTSGMMKWMMAPMNPKIWQQMLTHADPARYAKWSIALLNPTFYSPITDLTTAEWYTKRVDWLANPESYSPLLNLMMLDEYVTKQKQ